MNRFARGVRFTLVLSIITLAAVYLLLGYYYSDGFSYGTWINGIYCTGKSVEEVNELLKENVQYQTLSITDKDGALLEIYPEDIDLEYDYTESLKTRINNQNPLFWGLNLFAAYRSNIIPTINFDIDKLYRILADWEIFNSEQDLSVYIDFDKNGFFLVNEKESVPDFEAVLGKVNDAVYSEEAVLDLSQSDNCYKSIELTDDEIKIKDFFDKLNELQSPDISINIMNEDVTVTSSVAWEFLVTRDNYDDYRQEVSTKKQPWLGYFICNGAECALPSEEEVIYENDFVTDDDGNLYLSCSAIYDFASDLCDKYDTSYMIDDYLEKGSGEILISNNSKGNKGIYNTEEIYNYIKGYYLGENTEKSYSALLKDDVESHDGGLLGMTFIKVDMGEQELTYYVNGKESMRFPIVTGNVNRSRGTPSGIYNIYNKRHDTVLRGENYASFVHFLLGVYKGVGIHDASWRDEFGGEIYKSDGSHGCINCPSEEVEILWNQAEVGTPAILFY
ncbi:MAG: L,D-transpeptidase [Butyrivibrio sp.]|nr:L,D-transpeptidase [Butyrivibrio sp.]